MKLFTRKISESWRNLYGGYLVEFQEIYWENTKSDCHR